MSGGNKQNQAAALDYNKYILKNLLVNWKNVVENDKSLLKDKKLCEMIRYVKEYSNLEPSASHTKERQLYKKIFVNMQNYSKDLETKMEKSDDPRLAQSFSMMSDLNEFLVAQRDGYLKKPSIQDNHIISHDNQITMEKEIRNKIGKLVPYRDVPLFAKDPSFEHLQSENRKDSSIRAALGVIMKKNPDYIKESMLDNNDGTVTVRLFQAVEPVDQGEKPKNHVVYKPVYVTVDKSVPKAAVDQNALWVGIYEKAIVASGMFYGDKKNPVGRAVPANIDELYSKYKSLPKTEWPTRQECPWLINEQGELHKWKPSYEHINKLENQENILECIWGEQGRSSARSLGYNPEEHEVYKTSQVLEALYGEIIKAQTGSRQELRRIEALAHRYSIGNPQVAVVNMMLCAGLVSSMPNHEAQKYLENITCDKNGKIISFPVTLAQLFLEKLGKEVSQELPKNLKNVDLKQCENLLKNGVLQAEYKVKEQAAIIATEKNIQSIKKMAGFISGQGKTLYSTISAYTKEQENVFDELETILQRGESIVAGNTKLQQEGMERGEYKDSFLSNNFYGILGLTKEVIEGKEYKFVIMSGDSGLEYDFSKIPPVPTENKEAVSNGVVKVELNHFCNSCNQLTITGREMKSVVLAENMLTRKTISQYHNFFSYFENQIGKDSKDLKSLLVKEEFESLKGMFGKKKAELTDNLGKDMKAVSFQDMKEQVNKCIELLEKSETAVPKQLKTLKRLQTVLRLYETGMKTPKALLLDSIEHSMQQDNMLDTYLEGDCIKTIINSHGDILRLQKDMNKVESIFVNSSKEFDAMKESLNQLEVLMKETKSDSIPRKEYTDILESLLKNAGAYLAYKEQQRGKTGDSIKASGDLERDRIEMATKIKEYASVRCELMKHQNLRDALRLKTYQQLSNLVPSSKLSDKQKEFGQIVNSDTLNTILEKADDKTITKILKNPDAVKTFADKVDLKRSKTNEMSSLEKYRNAAIRAMDNREEFFSKRENLGRLLLADALIGINPAMKMGDLRKYEKQLFDVVLSSNTLSNCVVENDISKLEKRDALKIADKYSLSFRKELRGYFKEIKTMEDKTKEMASKVKDSKELKAKLEGKPDNIINKAEKQMEEEMEMNK